MLINNTDHGIVVFMSVREYPLTPPIKSIILLFFILHILFASIIYLFIEDVNIVGVIAAPNLTPINDLLIQNVYGQLQQQTEFIKYHHQSNFIKEFEVPVDNNDRGLKGITTDSKNNVWIYHNTNTSSVIIEFNPQNKTFTKYPIPKKTNVDNAITNLAGGQLTFDETRNLIWFSDSRTNSLGNIDINNKKINLYDIPTPNSGVMGITLSPDNKSIWFAEIIGDNIGNFDIYTKKIIEYPTGKSSGPTLLTFDDDGILWGSLSYSNEILRIEPWALISGIEFNGMLKIKLKEPDIFSPFGLSVVNNNNNSNINNTLFVSDHGSSRIIGIPIYNQNILNEEILNYTSYWTTQSNNFPNTLPSEIVSDTKGNIYFAEHGGNKIAKFSADTKTMTEYEIPTGPLATTVFISLSHDNTKIWFTEWASNKIGFLDLTKQIPYTIIIINETLYDKPLIFKNNTSYKINVSLVRNNFSISNQENLSLNNIEQSVAGMTDTGPKGIIYSFNPQRINLTENDRVNSLLTLDMVKDDKIRSENSTIMIIANTLDKNNLTTSVLYPLPISFIKPEESYANSSPSPSSILEKQTATNNTNYNTTKNLTEINFINIIKNVSLAIAIILIGYIIYKKLKKRKEIRQRKNDYSK
jgi:virginiamycin B lyase